MSNSLWISPMLVQLFVITFLVVFFFTPFSLLALALLTYMRRRATPLWKEQRRMSATYYGFLGERLNGLEDIRANGAGGAILRGFYQLLREWLPINSRANIVGAEMGITMLFLFVCGTSLALGLGLYLW